MNSFLTAIEALKYNIKVVKIFSLIITQQKVSYDGSSNVMEKNTEIKESSYL